MGSAFYHGTLNLVVSNGNCVVVATDSRATITDQQGKIIGRQDFHQKLFPITKDVVVTIAGYNSASVIAAPEFTAPAAAIITNYISQIKNYNHLPSYLEVIDSLTFLLNFHLTSAASINHLTGIQINPGFYLFQMIVIGHHERKIVVTKVILESKVTQGQYENYVESNIKSIKMTEINDKFAFETAGADSTAVDVLKNPDKYISFAAIRNYADHIKKDGGKNLTSSEMKDIVQTIMEISNKRNEGIGGPTQIALFENNDIKTSIPNFPAPTVGGLRFNLMVKSSLRGKGAIEVGPGVIMLYISSDFDNTDTKIDNQYYFGNSFHNCILRINSDSFSFDKSNKIQNCELIIGKDATILSQKIKELISNFKWRHVAIAGQ